MNKLEEITYENSDPPPAVVKDRRRPWQKANEKSFNTEGRHISIT